MTEAEIAIVERRSYEAWEWARENNRGCDQPRLVFARRLAFLLSQDGYQLARSEGRKAAEARVETAEKQAEFYKAKWDAVEAQRKELRTKLTEEGHSYEASLAREDDWIKHSDDLSERVAELEADREEFAEAASILMQERDAAEARVAELARGLEWRPIETAPKDGSAILLYAEAWEGTWGGVQAGSWAFGHWETVEGSVAEDEVSEVWDDDEEPLSLAPTHWMPLPAGPTGGPSK